MNKFYIYLYLDLNNIPFYVGKGKGVRYYVSSHLRKGNPNEFLKNKIRKVGVYNIKIYFLHKNLTEEEALQKERYWIKYYGRRDLGEGSLCNLTDGGEGPSLSEETKQKISKAKRGKSTALKGRKQSEEHKKAIRKARKLLPEETIRKVRKLYRQSIRQCQIAKLFNLPRDTIYSIVNYKTYKHVKD